MTYDKITELKKRIFETYSYYCAIPDCPNKAQDLHHMLPQTKVNKRNYPLFIHSVFNMIPVCKNCHMSKPLPKINYRVADLYEWYLKSITRSKNDEISI